MWMITLLVVLGTLNSEITDDKESPDNGKRN